MAEDVKDLRDLVLADEIQSWSWHGSLPLSRVGTQIRRASGTARGREKIRELNDEEGDILILSYHLSPGRVEKAGRALGPEVPRLSERGFELAVTTLHQLAREARQSGHRAVYHPHVGTFIETPDEVERLMSETDPDLLGLCLDTGHYTLGGGDAVEALRRYRRRLRHVHLKDVSASAMSALRRDPHKTFLDALRERIFTELGDGVRVACPRRIARVRGPSGKGQLEQIRRDVNESRDSFDEHAPVVRPEALIGFARLAVDDRLEHER